MFPKSYTMVFSEHGERFLITIVFPEGGAKRLEFWHREARERGLAPLEFAMNWYKDEIARHDLYLARRAA